MARKAREENEQLLQRLEELEQKLAKTWRPLPPADTPGVFPASPHFIPMPVIKIVPQAIAPQSLSKLLCDRYGLRTHDLRQSPSVAAKNQPIGKRGL